MPPKPGQGGRELRLTGKRFEGKSASFPAADSGGKRLHEKKKQVAQNTFPAISLRETAPSSPSRPVYVMKKEFG